MRRAFAILIAVLTFTGCAVTSPSASWPRCTADQTRVVCFNGNISGGIAEWESEFRAAGVHGPLVFVSVHGGDDGVRWAACPDEPFVQTPMDEILKGVKAHNPGYTVVLLSCNQGGYTISARGVYYPRRILRTHPHTGTDLTPPRATRFEDFTYTGD